MNCAMIGCSMYTMVPTYLQKKNSPADRDWGGGWWVWGLFPVYQMCFPGNWPCGFVLLVMPWRNYEVLYKNWSSFPGGNYSYCFVSQLTLCLYLLLYVSVNVSICISPYVEAEWKSRPTPFPKKISCGPLGVEEGRGRGLWTAKLSPLGRHTRAAPRSVTTLRPWK
jgi:hypothetical protein